MDDQRIKDFETVGTICGYARISFDTEREDDENTSIENQLKIINDYVRTHFPKCTLLEFKDRDRSGYTFSQREQYQVMRKKLISGDSKILIIKDFSRFARRNSLGLYELEQLRDAGVRIISVMDAIDYPTHDEWLMIQFRFLTNELPVTDTSKKVKNSVSSAQKNGEWLCAVPYGYVITNQKKKQYEIVPDEAEIVKKVFELYNNGWGYKKIANYLTSKHIPTPRMKEKMRLEEQGESPRRVIKSDWNIMTIQNILKNDFYIGTLRQHKYTRTTINGVDKKLSETENFVFEKHHESIVDDKTFLKAQELLKMRSTTHYRGVKKYENPYSGFLYCGDCLSPMFAMSRSDLAPAYTCGTYHKRGIKGCTSHHTRVDFLDNILRDYIKMVKINSEDMIAELEKSIAAEGDNVDDNDKVLRLLENQLTRAKEELKATKKQKIRDVSRDPDNYELYESTYAEIEDEIANRIYGIREQIKLSSNKRNDLIEINRCAKTAFSVFDDILNKEKLTKSDIGLIVEKILVYENGIIEIKLRSDIEHLLKVGELPNKEIDANFNFDSIGNSYQAAYLIKVPNHTDKAYTVNVINSGDPLEIYTDREGEVIFKKYSPIGELGDFASSYAETLAKTSGLPVCITDKDSIIAVSGIPRKELMEKRVSSDLEQVMTEKTSYVKTAQNSKSVIIADGYDKYTAGVVVPIISEGDSIGSVVMLGDESKSFGELETKLAQSAAGFLGKQMEQ